MKRHGYLWDKLVSLENLVDAETKARRGKRYRGDVASFHFGVEKELCLLRRELVAESYQPGAYRTFATTRFPSAFIRPTIASSIASTAW